MLTLDQLCVSVVFVFLRWRRCEIGLFQFSFHSSLYLASEIQVSPHNHSWQMVLLVDLVSSASKKGLCPQKELSASLQCMCLILATHSWPTLRAAVLNRGHESISIGASGKDCVFKKLLDVYKAVSIKFTRMYYILTVDYSPVLCTEEYIHTG